MTKMQGKANLAMMAAATLTIVAVPWPLRARDRRRVGARLPSPIWLDGRG